MILFLDDDKGRRSTFLSREPSAILTSTASECIDALSKVLANDRTVEQLWLDHDLSDRAMVSYGTPGHGGDVVQWLLEHRPKVDRIFVHTLNRDAGIAMVADLRRVGYRAIWEPWIKAARFDL